MASSTQMRQVRMTTASSVLGLFAPMVLDLAQELDKEVECLVYGADLEIDRKVLEAIKDPLIHLVRNAVDHGIEAPAARLKAGKPLTRTRDRERCRDGRESH